MSSGVTDFSPVETIGATRTNLAGRVRRRKRQMSSALAALLLVSAGAVAVAVQMGRPGNSPARQVAARGANGSPSTNAGAGGASTSALAVSPGAASTPGAPSTPGALGASTGISTTPPVKTVPSPSSVPGGPQATTVLAPTTTATTPTTVPGVTSTSTAIASAGSQVRGTVLFSPTCPVERVPPDPACAPRPGPAHIQLVRADGTIAAQGDAGSGGQFAISVAPGSYGVQAESSPAAPGIGRSCTASPAQVIVKSEAGSTVAVSCDTGIR